MAYHFYLDGVLLPVSPSKLTIKIGNNNKTINLINTGEVNILKRPKLTDIEFDIMLPNTTYPFAVYEKGFKMAKYYLGVLENLKIKRQTCQFIVSRITPGGKVLFDTNFKVSLEEYSITEDAKDGMDVMVTVKLKQYQSYGTKKIKVKQNTKTGKSTIKKSNPRPAKKVKSRTYKVKRGDCLWNIAKKFYGDGSKYTKIYQANKSKIKNPNLIYPGQVLTIPEK